MLRPRVVYLFLADSAAVGGISVKEHFEVNVAPIQIQMTYQLYKAVMQYFFPDKNIEVDDGKNYCLHSYYHSEQGDSCHLRVSCHF